MSSNQGLAEENEGSRGVWVVYGNEIRKLDDRNSISCTKFVIQILTHQFDLKFRFLLTDSLTINYKSNAS